MGDFGSATEAARIIDLFALEDYAKNLDCCNFRVLQHNPPKSGHYCERPLRATSGRSGMPLNGPERANQYKVARSQYGETGLLTKHVLGSSLPCHPRRNASERAVRLQDDYEFDAPVLELPTD